jgi:hypothetical protein
MPPMQIEGRTLPQLDRGLIAGLLDPAIRILQRNKYLHALLIGNERFEPEPASATREERPVPFAAFWRNCDNPGSIGFALTDPLADARACVAAATCPKRASRHRGGYAVTSGSGRVMRSARA